MRSTRISRTEIRDRALSFLRKHHTAVLATTNGENLHSAAITYLVDDKNDIYFVTKRDSAKAQNIRKNPKVSLVVYEYDYFPKSVQIQGSAERITAAGKTRKVIEQFVEKTWDSAPYLPVVFKLRSGGNLGLFKINMERIQLLEDSYHPDKVILESVVA